MRFLSTKENMRFSRFLVDIAKFVSILFLTLNMMVDTERELWQTGTLLQYLLNQFILVLFHYVVYEHVFFLANGTTCLLGVPTSVVLTYAQKLWKKFVFELVPNLVSLLDTS